MVATLVVVDPLVVRLIEEVGPLAFCSRQTREAKGTGVDLRSRLSEQFGSTVRVRVRVQVFMFVG